MTITDILERNAILYGKDTALVEINPDIQEVHRVTWKEYELIEPAPVSYYRREITWSVFNEKANRFANLLLSRGVKKGDKVVTGKYAGQELKLDGEDYVICKLADILAIVD